MEELDSELHSPVSHLVEDNRPAILVLDDDVLSLELYSRELSSNYQVITCENVEDAQQYFWRNSLSAVILEPAIDGEEGWLFLKIIHSSLPLIPVIVCSVLDERKTGLEQGADEYLVKPVLPTTLHQLIDKVILRRTKKF